MLVNPDIQDWFAKLHGRPLLPGGGGGFARGGGLPNYGTEVLQGIVKPGSGMFGFNAPGINAPRFSPSPIAQGGGPRGMVGSPLQFESGRGAGGDLGGAAKAAGMAKLGAGIESAAKSVGDKMRARQADLAAAQAGRLNGPGSFLSPTPPARPNDPTPLARPSEFTPPAPTFPPVGSASDTPILAQSNVGTGPMGESVGPGAGLPIFAQGAGPATADNGPGFVNQFLTGLKTGEGVPYSGQSRTGAIGAYGLTGGFIKDYAPGAGLPTDRASYMNNPALQDQLAKYAASQMYNKYGSWPQVANAWLTGSPTATRSAPGNMSPAAYDAKVMNAANAASPGAVTGANSPSAAAYAAQTPTARPETATALAGPQPVPDQGGPNTPEGVIPGQQDPHKPGFDAQSVPFINTPLSGEKQGMNDQPMRVAGPIPQNDTQPVPQDYNRLHNPGGLPYLGGNPQGQMPRPYQGGPDLGPQLPALPPQPQGMNDQISPLAAALAQNGQPMPQIDQSAALAMALSQPDMTVPPPVDFGGGEGGFDGGFGGFLGGLFG